MTALFIILPIIAVIAALVFINIDVCIDVSYNGGVNRSRLIVVFGFIKIKIFPRHAKHEKKHTEISDEQTDTGEKSDVIKFAKAVYSELKNDIIKLLDKFFKKVICIKELNLSAEFGTGDPMYTGIAAGAVNAAVYSAVSYMDRNMKLDKWNVSLIPNFNETVIKAGIYCKIRTNIFRLTGIIISAVRLLIKIEKINRRIKEDGGK